MRFPVSQRLMPAIVIVSAAASAGLLVALAPMARAAITTEASGVTPPPPNPTPTPVNAFLSLDVTAGDANTQITVNGGAFLANEAMTLYWDPPSNKVAGGANADGSGNFTTHVKPFSGDAPGVHHLCASVPPNPCATFTLQAPTATPTPAASPSPSPDTSPSPTASPTDDTASPTRVAAASNGIDFMLKPPFVIMPIVAGLGLALALGYWILSLVLRPRPKPLRSVAVAHLASRPDYAAAFGMPPAVPAPPAPQPSAWTDVLPPSTDVGRESAPEAPPPDAGEALPAAPDEPPDLPEPGDY
jgi:hypothetical protein